MSERFPTKVDAWIVVVLALGCLAVIAGCAVVIVQGRTREIPIAIGAVVFFAAIIFLLVWPMHYDLEESQLVVRFGVVRMRIPYDRVDEARPTRNPLSSPAFSLDRLLITYRRENGKATKVMISPREKERFLGELARRSGVHRIEGDRLVRG